MASDVVSHLMGVQGYKADWTLLSIFCLVRGRVFVGLMQGQTLLLGCAEGTQLTMIFG